MTHRGAPTGRAPISQRNAEIAANNAAVLKETAKEQDDLTARAESALFGK